MPNQTRWLIERRLKYADLIKQSRPWDKGGPKTEVGRQAVKYNKLQTGKQSAPALEIKQLLYQTNIVLKKLASLY